MDNQKSPALLVSSPSGQTEIEVGLSERGQIRYAVRWHGKDVIASSCLAIDLRPGGFLSDGLEVLDTDSASVDEEYPVFAGKSERCHDRHNELRVRLRERGGLKRRIDWVFRAFDDAAAFRYEVPEQDALKSEEVTVVAERSEFRFPTDYRCWPGRPPHFRTSHEWRYERSQLTNCPPGGLLGVPFTVEVGIVPNSPPPHVASVAVSITEAGLHDYAGMYLEGLAGGQPWLVTRLAPLPDGSYAAAHAKLPLSSPWRVIMMASEPVKLIESDVLYHLNEPCKLVDTSWVKPGRAVWDWWNGHAVGPRCTFTPGMNDDTMKYHIDFASEMGAEYMLIDGGWYGRSNNPDADVTKSKPEIDLPGLVRYANERGVDIMVWLHWKDLRERLDEVFAHYHRLNIKGVKVDFFDRDDQEIVCYITRLIESAARHQILVNLHGVYKPTGLERTWPHLMTHEGVYGLENSKWVPWVTPEHCVTIPFTRMLAGPMDFTPGGFDNVLLKDHVARIKQPAPKVLGTRAHQLAMYVVYQSALQMISDYADAIRGQPGSEFLKIVPAAWDETRGLLGSIGRHIAVARRRKNEWFVGAMAGAEAVSLSIPTEFLKGGQWNATLWADAPDADLHPKHIEVSHRRVSGGEPIDVQLATGGGCAIQLTPVA